MRSSGWGPGTRLVTVEVGEDRPEPPGHHARTAGRRLCRAGKQALGRHRTCWLPGLGPAASGTGTDTRVWCQCPRLCNCDGSLCDRDDAPTGTPQAPWSQRGQSSTRGPALNPSAPGFLSSPEPHVQTASERRPAPCGTPRLPSPSPPSLSLARRPPGHDHPPPGPAGASRRLSTSAHLLTNAYSALPSPRGLLNKAHQPDPVTALPKPSPNCQSAPVAALLTPSQRCTHTSGETRTLCPSSRAQEVTPGGRRPRLLPCAPTCLLSPPGLGALHRQVPLPGLFRGLLSPPQRVVS